MVATYRLLIKDAGPVQLYAGRHGRRLNAFPGALKDDTISAMAGVALDGRSYLASGFHLVWAFFQNRFARSARGINKCAYLSEDAPSISPEKTAQVLQGEVW